jgi:hypothetical protein
MIEREPSSTEQADDRECYDAHREALIQQIKANHPSLSREQIIKLMESYGY